MPQNPGTPRPGALSLQLQPAHCTGHDIPPQLHRHYTLRQHGWDSLIHGAEGSILGTIMPEYLWCREITDFVGFQASTLDVRKIGRCTPGGGSEAAAQYQATNQQRRRLDEAGEKSLQNISRSCCLTTNLSDICPNRVCLAGHSSS